METASGSALFDIAAEDRALKTCPSLIEDVLNDESVIESALNNELNDSSSSNEISPNEMIINPSEEIIQFEELPAAPILPKNLSSEDRRSSNVPIDNLLNFDDTDDVPPALPVKTYLRDQRPTPKVPTRDPFAAPVDAVLDPFVQNNSNNNNKDPFGLPAFTQAANTMNQKTEDPFKCNSTNPFPVKQNDPFSSSSPSTFFFNDSNSTTKQNNYDTRKNSTFPATNATLSLLDRDTLPRNSKPPPASPESNLNFGDNFSPTFTSQVSSDPWSSPIVPPRTPSSSSSSACTGDGFENDFKPSSTPIARKLTPPSKVKYSSGMVPLPTTYDEYRNNIIHENKLSDNNNNNNNSNSNNSSNRNTNDKMVDKISNRLSSVFRNRFRGSDSPSMKRDSFHDRLNSHTELVSERDEKEEGIPRTESISSSGSNESNNADGKLKGMMPVNG